MDQKVEDDGLTYTKWANMEMPPVHTKTAPLVLNEPFWEGPNGGEGSGGDSNDITYVYTNEGHLLDGVWRRFGDSRRGNNKAWGYADPPATFDPRDHSARVGGERVWEKGTCIVEFERTCSAEGSPSAVDLHSGLAGVKVQVCETHLLYRLFFFFPPHHLPNRFFFTRKKLKLAEMCVYVCVFFFISTFVLPFVFFSLLCIKDTDLSYRPRVTYSFEREEGHGRWTQADRGDCVDHVIRGCYNNGTCVAPNTCECASGWDGSDCSEPVCAQTCSHNGLCTHPNTCTCERGWEGYDCSVPVCAQQCLNGGQCVAPDTCQCVQYDMQW
jgi:hypothetical protein